MSESERESESESEGERGRERARERERERERDGNASCVLEKPHELSRMNTQRGSAINDRCLAHQVALDAPLQCPSACFLRVLIGPPE